MYNLPKAVHDGAIVRVAESLNQGPDSLVRLGTCLKLTDHEEQSFLQVTSGCSGMDALLGKGNVEGWALVYRRVTARYDLLQSELPLMNGTTECVC